MSNFTINDILSYNPNLTQHILWQYDNAAVLKALIEAKKTWYYNNLQDFWQQIVNKFLNIATADDWGLNLWGKILQVKRLYNINGSQISLSKELYRRLIKGKFKLLFSDGSIPEIHKYCNDIFKDYIKDGSFAVYVKDNNDMSLTYTINFEPTTEELALLYDRSFLPTPAGVKASINIMPAINLFGFFGTEFQPFNQGIFWNGNSF